MIGRSLSHFEIAAKLGEGGMGEVWRARDTRLDREVAIKVLPEAFTADPERLARFEREAKVLASLNHPNIGGIYDLVEADDSRALVLELVEGPTLAGRIVQGPIPMDEALPIARQIAEALEAAHAQGIVHRDLKPANIKITPAGKVKVLDFGLAKALLAESESGTAGFSQSPTIGQATQLGTILGTVSYMAPEQARGLPTDKRADIWAFGCVLYEMLTGASPFGGATDSDTIAAVLRAEPSWQPLPDATPLAVRRLLERCLRKEVERRLRDAGDARLELEDAEREPDAAAGPATSAHTRRRSVWWPAVTVVATILALGLLVERLVRPQAVQRPVEFEIHPPPGTSLSTWLRARPVVSPDGSHVVFSVMEESVARLWVRRLDNLEVWPLEGTESAVGASWSPDGRQIAFSATSWRGLRKIDVGGGASELMTREAAAASSWGRAGGILTSFPNGPLRRVFAGEGGWTSKPLSSLDPSRQETGHEYAEFLPDGEQFFFFVRSPRQEHTGTFVASLSSPDSRKRVVPASPGSYADPGYVLYAQEGALLARPFDLGRLEASGEPAVIVDRLAMLLGRGMYSVSRTGVLAYRRSLGSGTQLVWFDRQGNRLEALPLPEGAQSPELSPDGERLAFERIDPKTGYRDIWMWEFQRRAPTKLTTHPGGDSDPVWSPDGEAIIFTSDRRGLNSLHRKQVGSAAPPDLIHQPDGEDWGTSWSPDGEHLLFSRWPPGVAEGQIFLLPLSGSGVAKRMLDTDSQEGVGQFSPDGKWIVYMTEQTGRIEVYIQPFPQTGEVIQVSTGGGGLPRWRGDGAEIYYLDLEGRLMAVALSFTESGLRPSPPKALFQPELPQRGFVGVRNVYDVSSDGQRFLVATETGEARPATIVVVTDWTRRLGR